MHRRTANIKSIAPDHFKDFFHRENEISERTIVDSLFFMTPWNSDREFGFIPGKGYTGDNEMPDPRDVLKSIQKARSGKAPLMSVKEEAAARGLFERMAAMYKAMNIQIVVDGKAEPATPFTLEEARWTIYDQIKAVGH